MQVHGVIVAPRVRDLTHLGGQLAAWLAARLPQATDIRIENLAYPLGAGQSHETILFDARWSTDGRRSDLGMVVRIKPTAHMVYPDDLFDSQYRLMCLLHEHGWAPVAKPLWFEEDPEILGAPFFVMQKVRGRVAVSIPPYAQVGWVAEATPVQRAKLWENGVRQLAALQRIPLSALPFLAGPEGARSGLEQEWDKYARFVAWISRDHRWPVLEAALEHLRDRWPTNQPPGLVWGDARLGNLMFNDDCEVAAVMDWEQPSLGGALNDLAWWLVMSDAMHSTGSGRPHLEGMGTREETIALWHALTGISTEDLDWYEDFTALKVGCLSVSTAKVKGAPLPDHAGLARRLNLRTTV
jgi:aminoglycoside phosphotransferase (APT) family kinase protein